MLPRSERAKRVHSDCPPELVREIDVTLAAAIAGQGILAGETIDAMARRLCPEIFDLAAAQGFDLRLDLAENTHRALCKGRVAYQIRRRPAN